jgi:hypothetical protein
MAVDDPDASLSGLSVSGKLGSLTDKSLVLASREADIGLSFSGSGFLLPLTYPGREKLPYHGENDGP